MPVFIPFSVVFSLLSLPPPKSYPFFKVSLRLQEVFPGHSSPKGLPYSCFTDCQVSPLASTLWSGNQTASGIMILHPTPEAQFYEGGNAGVPH